MTHRALWLALAASMLAACTSTTSFSDAELSQAAKQGDGRVYRSSYHLTPASNRCLVYATLVRTSFGINFRPFLNML
ncbi:hypothetical protein FRN27_22245 [Aeromonas salmonicida]|nr:hypothetical protein [Aeromonas salmonicida]